MNQEVSISTHTKQKLSKAPAVVSVITEDDIKATGAVNLTDVLEGVPGIHIRASYFGNRPLIQFRGANANQTLLMINGVPLRDLTYGFSIFWKGLPVSIIERVEIIRGPGSALFGADASAGVINVITKTAGKINESIAGVRVGSFNSKTAWAQHGGSWSGYDLNLTAELSATDGHNPYIAADRQTVDSQPSLAPGIAEYGWGNQDIRFSVAKGNWRLLADYTSHSDLEVGMVGRGVIDPLTHASDSRYNIDLLYRNDHYSQNWGVDVDLRYHHLDYTSGDGFQEHPAGHNGGYAEGDINQQSAAERRYVLDVSGLYRGIEHHALRLGAGITVQDLYRVEHRVTTSSVDPTLKDLTDTVDAFAPENARTIMHVYLQDVWTISDTLELTAGGRYDHYSDFGGSFNPRLAMVWNSSDRLTTKLMYGEAFRAPSYLELYAGTYTQPNPDLKPEESQTTELAFGYEVSNDLQMNLNLFHYKLDNVLKSTSGSHTIDGIELEAQWQASREVKVSGNVTFRNQEDSGARALDEADKDAYLRMDWGFRPNWNWNLQANWIGERIRTQATDTRP
ncbi:MAG: TonB-dependent receptor, partial [Chromatiales bacterium]|nr:TonB-dependent receptor [Chromatiales bacterium]